MQRSRSWLTLSLFFIALLVLILFWAGLSSMFLGFLYRSAAGFSATRSVTEIASILTGAFLLIVGALIAVPIAFQPGSLMQRPLYVIPLFFIILTFVGVISNIVGIGTTGTLVDLGNGLMLNFSATWVVIGLILSAIAVLIAVARTNLASNTLKNAVRLTSVSGGLGVIAAAGLVATVIIVSTNQPTFGFPGGPPPGQGAPAQGTEQAGRGGGQGNGQPRAQGTEQAGQRGGQGGQQGARPGGAGQAGPGPGGPGGGPTALTRTFSIGGIAGGIVGIILLVSIFGGMRSLSSLSSEPAVPVVDYRRGVGSVLVSFVIVGVIVFVAIQLVPVSRDNPPVTSNIQWDSPQTQRLVERACANCHSNTTVWPWYAYIAPSAWLTTMHVHSARSFYNLSEMSTTELARFAQNAPMAIRMGEMPPADYLFMHPEARLTDAEKQQLVAGLQKTFPRQEGQGGFGFNLNGF